MHIDKAFCDLLLCPKSGQPLTLKNGCLYSEAEKIEYKNYEGIPWLFRHPQVHLYQWQQHIKNFLVSVEKNVVIAENEMRRDGIISSSAERFKLLRQANVFNSQVTLNILESFALEDELAKPKTSDFYFDRLPSTQHINSYLPTIFRDWSWGQKENALALDLVKKMFSTAPESLVVLGSGSSRLAIDLHNSFAKCMTLAVDINPILLLAAKKIIFDGPLEFYDIPVAPIELKDLAVKLELKNASPALKNFYFLFADALNLPLKTKSVRAILTPWFIDIIPQDLQTFAKRVNCHLKDGGEWVNFGPLGYGNSLQPHSYTADEIFDILKSAGFEILKHSIERIPYLASPHSSQHRNEKVLLFSAKKKTHLEAPSYFSNLPRWIIDSTVPVPKTMVIDQSLIKTKTYAQMLELIDGKRSQNELVPEMVAKFGFTEDMAKEALSSFLVTLFEGRI